MEAQYFVATSKFVSGPFLVELDPSSDSQPLNAITSSKSSSTTLKIKHAYLTRMP